MLSSRNRTPIREPIVRPGRELPIGRKLVDCGLGKSARFNEIRGSRRFSTSRYTISSRHSHVHRRGMGYDAQCDVRFDGADRERQGGSRTERSRPAGSAASVDSTRSDLRGDCVGRLAPRSLRWPARRNQPRPGCSEVGAAYHQPAVPTRQARGQGGSPDPAPRRSRGSVRRRAASRRSDGPAQDGSGHSRVRRHLPGRRTPGIARAARGARVEDRALGSNLDVAPKRAASRHRGGYDGGRQAGGPRRRQSRQLLRHADGRKVRDPGRQTTQGECRRQAIDRTGRCAAKDPTRGR